VRGRRAGRGALRRAPAARGRAAPRRPARALRMLEGLQAEGESAVGVHWQLCRGPACAAAPARRAATRASPCRVAHAGGARMGARASA
jgi:hypothetical protein